MTYLKTVINKTEQEIMKDWGGSILDPLVSISCTTFNHEKYITEAVDGILMQETSFPFEILIHDDASTDNTQKIINLYHKKYPNIIKPIYQTENQFSKGSNIVTYNYSRAKGKYIAICEGDDFWTDKEKLQYQIKKMEENKECNISFHPAKIVFNQTMTKYVTSRHLEYDTIFNIKEVIKGDGGFCPTVSLIVKKEVIDNLPQLFKSAFAGDYILQIFGSLNAGALYIDRTMSAYRKHEGGVWTSKQKNFESIRDFASSMSITLNELDIFFNHKYHNEIIFVESNIYLTILNNSSYPINDRIDLYHTCKNKLSYEQQLKQQNFISEQGNISM